MKFNLLIHLILFSHLTFYSCQNRSARDNNQSVYNVKEYGCTGDGLTLETANIQQTIDLCSENGGGVVHFPPGTYLTGSLEMFDFVTLDLSAGATILGSPDLKDYTETQYVSESRSTALIYAHGRSQIAITGRGEIIGNDSAYFNWDKIHPGCCMDPSFTRQGESYSNGFPDGPVAVKGDSPETSRPGSLISFINCDNILISDIRISGSPNWCVHMACCRDIDITNVDIHNSLLVPNADGIDVSKCKRVAISDCNIIAGDDGIAIGTCADGYCSSSAEDITISNCIITSRSAGIRLGWSTDDIRNILMDNLVIHSNRGIGIFVRHDEVIENIRVSNSIIHTRLHSGWWGNGEPIHISQIPLGELHGISSEGKEYGKIKNVDFSDLTMSGESGVVVYGYNDSSIEDISFHNLRSRLKNSPMNKDFGGNFDLRPAFSMELSLFEHDIPALFFKKVNGLTIQSFDQEWDMDLPEFVTHGIYGESCKNVIIDHYYGSPAPDRKDLAVIQFVDSEQILIEDSESISGTNTFTRFIRSSGVKTDSNNDMEGSLK